MSRFAIALVVLAACGRDGHRGYVNTAPRPAVMPMLSELPDGKRDQILDSARERPSEEQRRRDLTPRARKVELGAALGAALLGQAFSTTGNTTIGVENVFDETGQLLQMQRARQASDQRNQAAPGTAPAAPAPPPPPAPKPDANELVPWVDVTNSVTKPSDSR